MGTFDLDDAVLDEVEDLLLLAGGVLAAVEVGVELVDLLGAALLDRVVGPHRLLLGVVPLQFLQHVVVRTHDLLQLLLRYAVLQPRQRSASGQVVLLLPLAVALLFLLFGRQVFRWLSILPILGGF